MDRKGRYALLCALVALALVVVFTKSKDVEPPELEKKEDAVEEVVSVSAKKERFLEQMVPVVEQVYNDLQKRYEKVRALLERGGKNDSIAELKREYKADTDAELLQALKPHPPSVALAQAAMESAWGTSRFFTEANNVFGVWSFNANEPRIAAGERRGDKTIWVRKYDSLEESVRDYYRLLGRSSTFEEFRELRMHSTDPHALVKKLHRYSEKKHAYGEELSAVIRYNKFTRFDDDQS
ncbi:MAG: glucosaminidase domain-containing protein [Desulfuromonadaceae bacterium]